MKYVKHNRLLVALVDKKPAGVLQLGQAAQDKNLYWMKFVTVHPDFRKSGIARSLIREMCNYVSKIENAKIDLSSYEKEGEVMMDTVKEIAHEFNSLPIRHRTWATPYQDAKNDFFRNEDEVLVDDDENNMKGQGKILYFVEEEPVRAVVKLENKENAYKVLLKYLRKR